MEDDEGVYLEGTGVEPSEKGSATEGEPGAGEGTMDDLVNVWDLDLRREARRAASITMGVISGIG